MLNPDQIKQMIQWSSQNPDNPNALEFQRRIQSGQYNDSLSQLGVNTSQFTTRQPTTEITQPKQEGALPGFISDIGSSIQKRGQQFAQQSADIAQQVKTQPTTPGQPPAWLESAPQQALSLLGQGAGSILDIIGAGAKRVGQVGAQLLDKIAPGFTQSIGSNLQDMVSKISSVPVVMKDAAGNPKDITIGDIFQGGADTWNKFKQSNPAQAADIENTLNIAATLAGGAGAKKATTETADTLTGITSKLPDIVTPIEKTASEAGQAISQKAGEVAGKVGGKLQDKYLTQELKGWTEPTTINKPAFNKATEIYKNASSMGHNIGDTIVKNKINLADHIENGVYNTVDTADKIRTDASKMSSDLLRPSLRKADLTVPKTPVDELINSSINNITKNKSITQETKDSLIEELNKTKNALQKKFPDGMGLEDLHDEKIVRDMNAKYSPIGDIATNNQAIKNKAVADSARNLIESKAPSDIPVKEFNNELKKQYQAADYLEALNSKKVPQSIASKIAKTTAKVVGATVGHGMGGGILGGVGGYHIGGMIEGLFENMSNPIKKYFLQNLEATNPEVFSKLKDYLK